VKKERSEVFEKEDVYELLIIYICIYVNMWVCVWLLHKKNELGVSKEGE
jgi:hypothetical protein